MDFKQIQTIIRDFEKSTLTSLEIEAEGFKISLKKQGAETVVSMPKQQATKGNEAEEVVYTVATVRSPLVGTYYASASPDKKPFVKVGDKVKKGQTVCIIEAMKIMNEIPAPMDGEIEKILVFNGDAVGYDQVIMVIS